MTRSPIDRSDFAKPFLLGEWHVDSEALQLTRENEVIHVQPKAMRLLMILVQNAGKVVRKETLLDIVWDHRYVVEGVLKRRISDLRKALGDDSSDPRYIETIPKRGYRLICNVSTKLTRKVAPTDTAFEPYLGLETFRFDHSHLFFGRERACSDICRLLDENAANGSAFLMVLGMSGVGKSSLVRAGVVPKLLRKEIDRRAVFSHSDTPGDVFDGLAVALMSDSALPELYSAQFGPKELAVDLREQPQEVLRHICEQIVTDRNDAKLLLVIDQMEELFAFKRVELQERQSFFSVLNLMATSGCISVIGTMRSDYYHRFCESADLLEMKSNGGQYDLVPPTATEIRSIIGKPAELAGLTFEISHVDGGALNDVIEDAAVKHPEALPLLQFVLRELYKRRDASGLLTFDAYHKLGGVEGCLGQQAEKTYTAQSPNTKKALPHVLGSLVTAVQQGATPFSLRSALRSVLVVDRNSEQLVNALTEARLLTTHLTHDGKSRVVRVAHEALFLHWDRARRWLAQNIRFVRSHQRLTESAHRWEREGKRNDLLLSKGWQLSQAESLLDKNRVLTEHDLAYLKLSRRHADRKSLITKSLIASVSVLAIIAFGSLYTASGKDRLATLERDRAEQESQVAKQTIALLSHMFEMSDPATRRSQNISPKEMLDEGADRVKREFSKNPFIQATLLHTIGVVYNRRGLYQEAQRTLDITVRQLSSTLGENHPLVGDALHDLAEAYHNLGEFDKAVSTNQRALELRRQIYGGQHRAVAESLHQKGWILHSIGEPVIAEQLVREGLAAQNALQDAGESKLDLDLATSHKSLGIFLFQRGELAEAEPHLRTALNIRRKHLGSDHPDVGMSLNHLAGLYTSMEEYDQAMLYSKEALELNRKLLGEEHPDVALSYYNLASVLYRLDKFEEAAKYALSCIEINTKSLGENHGIVAISKGFLSSIRLAQGKPNEALELLTVSSKILEQTLPADHWRIAWLEAIRGAVLAELGQESEGERLLFAAYHTIGGLKGASDNTTLRVGEFLLKLYDPDVSAEDYQRVHDKMRVVADANLLRTK